MKKEIAAAPRSAECRSDALMIPGAFGPNPFGPPGVKPHWGRRPPIHRAAASQSAATAHLRAVASLPPPVSAWWRYGAFAGR